MDIKEIKDKKFELENKLQTMFRIFTEETRCNIDDVAIDKFKETGDREKLTVMYEIVLDIKI